MCIANVVFSESNFIFSEPSKKKSPHVNKHAQQKKKRGPLCDGARQRSRQNCEQYKKMQSGDNDDSWANIEEQYLQSIEAEPDYERQYNNERESSIHKVWSSFQDSATSIAHLYKGKMMKTLNHALLFLRFPRFMVS